MWEKKALFIIGGLLLPQILQKIKDFLDPNLKFVKKKMQNAE